MVFIVLLGAFALLSLAGFALKAYVVWEADHDVYNGGGVPTMDFPLIYPVVISTSALPPFIMLDIIRFPTSAWSFGSGYLPSPWPSCGARTGMELPNASVNLMK